LVLQPFFDFKDSSLDKNNIEIIVAIIGCVIGVGGAIIAIHARWKASIEKGYAAQRDFQHLKRNQENISMGIAQIDKDISERLDQIDKDIDTRLDRVDLAVNRIENMLHSLLVRRREE
jgi:hypothetical protein